MKKFIPSLLTVLLFMIALTVWLNFRNDQEANLKSDSIVTSSQAQTPSRTIETIPDELSQLGAQEEQKNAVATEPGAEQSGATKQETGTLITVRSEVDGQPVPGIDVYVYSHHDFLVRAKNLLGTNRYDLVRQYADHYRCNELGQVRIRAATETKQLLALDDSFEGGSVVAASQEAVGLSVQPYPTVHVRVVDEQGDPAIGMPLTATFTITSQAGSRKLDVWTGKSEAPSGLVRIPFYNMFIRLEPSQITVALGGRLAEVVEAEIDFYDWPEEPITLVAPQSGSILVKVQSATGLPLAETSEFLVCIDRLNATAESVATKDNRSPAPAAFTANGLARLPLLALAERYRIRLLPEVECGYAALTQDVAGPTVAGEEVAVVLSLPEELTRCVLKGRAVDETGAVLSAISIHARSQRNPRDPRFRRVSTDATGRFTMALDLEHCGPDEEWWLNLEQGDDRRSKIRASRNLSGFTAGQHDLGDVVFVPDPILASGRVVGPDRQPLANVQLDFILKGMPIPDGFVTPLLEPSLFTDAEGRFCYRGLSDATELAITGFSPGYSEFEETVPTGATDLEFQLSAQSWLRAQIEVAGDEPSRLEGYRYEMRSDDGVTKTLIELIKDGKIDQRLKPGRYDFLIFHQSDSGTPAYSKPDLILRPSSTVDLGVISLASPGIKVEITIITGAPDSDRVIDGTMRLFEPGAKFCRSETDVTIRSDPLVLFVKSLPFEIELELEYCRTQRQRISEAKTSIDMTPRLELGIEVIGLEAIPDGILSYVALLPHSRTKEPEFADLVPVTLKNPTASFYLPQPGDYDLFFWVGGPMKDHSFFKVCINRDDMPRISVLDQVASQTLQFQLTKTDLEKVRSEIDKRR